MGSEAGEQGVGGGGREAWRGNKTGKLVCHCQYHTNITNLTKTVSALSSTVLEFLLE